MDPVRAAVVGCGLVGRKRAEALQPYVEAIELYDTVEERSIDLSRALGGSSTVHACAVDAFRAIGPGGLAVIATSHDMLAPSALTALAEGCHVLIEKPGARTADELDEVLHAARRRDLLVRVGFNHRFHPAVVEARRLMHHEAVGPVLVVRARYGHGGRLGYEREWRADPARSGGGELLDQGVHLLDLTRYLTGDLGLRYGAVSTRYWDMPVEDNAFMHLALPEGGDGWLHASWTEWKNLFSFEITCREVKLELTGLGGSYGPEKLSVFRMPPELGPPLVTTTEWPPGDGSWRLEIEDVITAIRGGVADGATGDDARATLHIVDAIYGS